MPPPRYWKRMVSGSPANPVRVRTNTAESPSLTSAVFASTVTTGRSLSSMVPVPARVSPPPGNPAPAGSLRTMVKVSSPSNSVSSEMGTVMVQLCVKSFSGEVSVPLFAV